MTLSMQGAQLLPFLGLHILITRPLHQAQNLYQKITALGGHCVLLPTMVIVSIPLNTAYFNQTLHTADKIIFVSSNAVAAVMPDWPAGLSAKEIFAIGPATALALSNHNITAHIPSDGMFHSEGLLALPHMQTVHREHIIILKGEGGRTLLTETLQARGANVTSIDVYRRQLAHSNVDSILQQYQKNSLGFIISTSCESLENLHTLFAGNGKDWLLQQRLLLVSPRMQLLAEQLGFQKTVIAANATDDAIIKTLLAVTQPAI